MMSPMEVSTYLGMANIALRTYKMQDKEAQDLSDKIAEACATAQLYLMRMSMDSLAEELTSNYKKEGDF